MYIYIYTYTYICIYIYIMSNLLTRERKTKSIKLRRMVIKEFKNELRNLKIILDEIKT